MDEIPEVVREARKAGSRESERGYIDACYQLRQCHSCGSARKYCQCGRPRSVTTIPEEGER